MAARSNTTVAPRIDRCRVLRDAWVQCKCWYEARRLKFTLVRAKFQWALKCAWSTAKRELMTAKERRTDAIQRELSMLSFKSFHINTEARQHPEHAGGSLGLCGTRKSALRSCAT